MAWDAFMKAVRDLKNIHVSDDAEKNRAFQLQMFTKYYKAFNKIMMNIPPEKLQTISQQPYMKDLMELGFRPPETQQEEKFDSPGYLQRVQEDFSAYIS